MSHSDSAQGQRWFQFSLRSALLLMFLTAGLLAWYSNGMSHYRALVAATTQLKTRGAIVEWYLRPWPQFDKVTRISLRGTQPTSDDLRILSGLTDLAWLSLARTPVTDADMAGLGSLVNLQEIDLSETQIGDEGLLMLARLPNLSIVKVGGTRVTVDGLMALHAIRPDLTMVEKATSAFDIEQASSTAQGLAPDSRSKSD
jgi:hypothetical protein